MRVHAREGKIADDALQNIVEIVRYAAREQAHGFELALLEEFGLGFLFCGHVAKNHDGPDDAAVAIANRRGADRR